jgi:hypothetical protein
MALARPVDGAVHDVDDRDVLYHIVRGSLRVADAGSSVRPNATRARILAQLKEAEGRHLVIVRYGSRHSLNRKLLEYFKDRYVWLVEAAQDHSAPELVPYPVESSP